MKFELGDTVYFIYQSELCRFDVIDYEEDTLPMYQILRSGWTSWVRESDLALVKLPVVPLYYVVFLPDDEFSYLKYNTIDRTAFVSEKIERDEFKTKFTEEEIKNMDERYWAFAVPAEDLEV
ncbi:TPA_asm: DUF1642 domain-containing protein [Listeria monocytogenes]|nr:DUF1642 domain-containing protein [Listeria monocytogenes]HAB6531040.1 DUF1642 domain-containing protein [Listeria monocytogenes]HAC4157545.1 DUF1642 domain-containing protein [Listeria monocytogenes]HAC4187450.1 DUF1642 domain-containing protein [Listeria monocytogenes]